MTWKDRGAIAVATATVFLFYSTTSASAAQCGPTKRILEDLKAQYHEEMIGTGVASTVSGHTLVVSLLVAPNGSWTFMTSTPSGFSCIRASGEGWAEVPLKERDPHGPPA